MKNHIRHTKVLILKQNRYKLMYSFKAICNFKPQRLQRLTIIKQTTLFAIFLSCTYIIILLHNILRIILLFIRTICIIIIIFTSSIIQIHTIEKHKLDFHKKFNIFIHFIYINFISEMTKIVQFDFFLTKFYEERFCIK